MDFTTIHSMKPPGSSFGMLFSVSSPKRMLFSKAAIVRKRTLFWKIVFFWDLVQKGVKQQDCSPNN